MDEYNLKLAHALLLRHYDADHEAVRAVAEVAGLETRDFQGKPIVYQRIDGGYWWVDVESPRGHRHPLGAFFTKRGAKRFAKQQAMR